MSNYRLNPATPAAAVVALALFMLGWLVREQIVYLAATLILGTVVHAAWFTAPLPTLQLSGVVRLRVGETGSLHVQVRNETGKVLPPAVLAATLPGLDGPPVGLPRLAPGDVHDTRIPVTAVARGGADQIPVTLTQWGMFRAASRRTRFDRAVTVRVHPPAADLLPVVQHGAQGAEQLTRRPGAELDTVREWRPGDSRRAVQWRATARHGRLVVAERHDPGSRVLQLLVLGHTSGGAEPAIARATATAVTLARQGVTVRCVSFDAAGRPRTARSGTGAAIGDWAAMLGAGPGPVQPPTPPVVLRELLPDADLLVLALPDSPPALLEALAAHGPFTRLLPDGSLG